MAEMANIVADGYSLLADPSVYANPVVLLAPMTALIQRSWKLDTRLQAFYKRLESQTTGPVYWSQLSKGFNNSIQGDMLDGIEVFPVAFQFQDIDTAHTCTRFWATNAILWSGMKFIYTLLGTFSPAILAQIPPLEHRADVSALAKNICQSVEYFISRGKSVGPVLTAFPLKVAIETLNDDVACGRELAWAKAAMERIAGSGVKIMGHLGVPVEQHSFIPGPDTVKEESVVV